MDEGLRIVQVVGMMGGEREHATLRQMSIMTSGLVEAWEGPGGGVGWGCRWWWGVGGSLFALIHVPWFVLQLVFRLQP